MSLDAETKFCPKCESEMVLRMATKGLGAGKQFWGCSAYPAAAIGRKWPERAKPAWRNGLEFPIRPPLRQNGMKFKHGSANGTRVASRSFRFYSDEAHWHPDSRG